MPRRAASVSSSGTSSRSGTRRTVSARARPVTSVCPPRGDPRRCARADQPSPANLLLTSGTFDKIPHYPRSQTLAAPSQTNGVAEQSLAAEDATPEQIVRWYTTNLTNGWSLTENPHATGTDAWQASWLKNNQRVVVTASKATTLPNEGAAVGQEQVQYTIQVYPPPSQG
jgi:hypothetical protein